MSSRDIIPLFPLGKILFPKMVLPLHIFEERYKELVAECLEKDSSFAVLLNESPLREAIGTSAIIRKVTKTYPDGRMDILIQGVDRIQIVDVISDRSFFQGEIEIFKDKSNQHPAVGQIESLLDLYHHFISKLDLDDEQKKLLNDLVDDINEERDLSYVIGQTIGLDPISQQDLLSQTTPSHRIKLLTDELHRHQQIHSIAREIFEKTDFDPLSN